MCAANLWVGNAEVGNIFQLLGYEEDSISLAISWSLANSNRFCGQLLDHVIGKRQAHGTIDIRIHRYETDGGITDIEIIEPNE